MPDAQVNGITIYHEVHGPDDGKPILMITGVGTQMTRYPPAFVDKLVARGYRVIKMDNRDIGLSQKFTEHGIPDAAEAFAAKKRGEKADLPYQMSDMAADCAALLDHLGIDKAHVCGFSMGGMIAQLVAIEHPDKVLSMTSIMSSSGNAELPAGTPEARKVLTSPRPDPNEDREAFLDSVVNTAKVIGSPAWPQPEAAIREQAEHDLERSYHPTGFARQYAAIQGTYDRREHLKKLTMPCTVIHGVQDPLVPVEAGRDTAAHIPNCTLIEIDGMGHNIPPELWDRLIDGIETATLKA